MGFSTLLSMTTLFLEILLLLPLLSNAYALDLSPPFSTNFLFGTASSSYQVYTYLQNIYLKGNDFSLYYKLLGFGMIHCCDEIQ